MPTDPVLRAEAQRIQRWFDDELTPRIRRAVLDALLRQPGYFASIFAAGAPVLTRRAYACIVPFAAPLIRKGNGISGADAVADGLHAGAEALDFVAARGAATGLPVRRRVQRGRPHGCVDGSRCWSASSISPMSRPQPVASRTRELVDRFAGHPGAAWVRRMYDRASGRDRDFDGPSESCA